MKVDIARNDQISVQYYPTHYGHTAEPPLQAPSSTTNTNSTLGTINGELVEQSSVQQHTIPSIQTVVQAAVQQTQTTTDHCVRLQHQHHAQTSSIIINIAPVSLLYFSVLNFFQILIVREIEILNLCFLYFLFSGKYNDHQMRIIFVYMYLCSILTYDSFLLNCTTNNRFIQQHF